MRALLVIFLCLAEHCLNVVAHSLMIVMTHSATYMSPGDTFDFRCAAEPLKPNMVIQIVKTKMEYVGSDSYYSRSLPDGPFLISNDSELNPILKRHTERYSISKHNGAIRIYVRETEAGDSGTWACRVVEGPRVLRMSNQVDVVVVGKMYGMDILHRDITQTIKRSFLRREITEINEHDRGTVVCQVNITNVEPQYDILLKNSTHTDNVTKDFYLVVTGNLSIKYQVLMDSYFRMEITARPRFSLTYQDHGKEFACRATLPFGPPLQRSFFLNVTFAPKEARCVTQEVGVAAGATNFRITCHVVANPRPSVEWQLPDGMKVTPLHEPRNFQITNERVDHHLRSTLLIARVRTRDFGSYRMKAYNDYGHMYAYTKLVETYNVRSYETGRRKEQVSRVTARSRSSSFQDFKFYNSLNFYCVFIFCMLSLQYYHLS